MLQLNKKTKKIPKSPYGKLLRFYPYPEMSKSKDLKSFILWKILVITPSKPSDRDKGHLCQ